MKWCKANAPYIADQIVAMAKELRVHARDSIPTDEDALEEARLFYIAVGEFEKWFTPSFKE